MRRNRKKGVWKQNETRNRKRISEENINEGKYKRNGTGRMYHET
jgi:hypothetical protein